MASESNNIRTLAFLCAVTAGIILVMALQVVLAARGLQIADMWRDMMANQKLGLRAAMVWWVVAGTALVIGAATAWVLAHHAPPWHRQRALRWVAGIVAVFVLAHLGHSAGAPEGITGLVYLIASGTAIVIAGVMASIGAIFALRS